MEPNEATGQSSSSAVTELTPPVLTPSQHNRAQPANEASCPTCAGAANSMPLTYVYAIGRIEARFPRLSVEKEYAQATGRAQTAGEPNQGAFYKVLTKPESRYLARQLCWVFTIQGLETYVLQPRDPGDFDRLIGAAAPERAAGEICRRRLNTAVHLRMDRESCSHDYFLLFAFFGSNYAVASIRGLHTKRVLQRTTHFSPISSASALTPGRDRADELTVSMAGY